MDVTIYLAQTRFQLIGDRTMRKDIRFYLLILLHIPTKKMEKRINSPYSLAVC